MNRYTREEILEALEVVTSITKQSEKIQPKFIKGSSQYKLLENRIKALNISKSLLTSEDIKEEYTKEELIESLLPISSIISKCEKAQMKFAKDNYHQIRLMKIIAAMNISKSLISNVISNEKNQ
jgi:hypothetical protein